MTYDPASIPQRLNTTGVFNLAFKLSSETDCVVPNTVAAAATQGKINADLGLGVHYFYTAVEETEVSWAALQEFVHRTDASSARHVFNDAALSRLEEKATALSNEFGWLLGVGFAAEHLKATWFQPLAKAGETTFDSANGIMTASRADPDQSWPDCLAASFHPNNVDTADLGGFYALEFKGKGAFVKFEHQIFQNWIQQARNIDLKTATGRALALKSWVIAFNYRCKAARQPHEHSALLVHDPRVGPEDAPLPASPDPIIREHLARQCRKLGFPGMSRFVLAGMKPPFPNALPTAFKVGHPLLKDRRYVGNFVTWGSDGELVAAPAPTTRPPFSQGTCWIDVIIDAHDPKATSRTRVEVEFANGHARIRSQGPDAPQLLPLLGLLNPGSNERSFFIGQDATMLRSCFSTPLAEKLDDIVFQNPIEISTAGGEGDEQTGALQLLRNGSIIAAASRLKGVDENFWQAGPNNHPRSLDPVEDED